MSELVIDILIKNINQLMKKFAVTQERLAEDLHIGQPSISKYLTKKSAIPFEFIYDTAKYFDVSIDELCTDSITEDNLESNDIDEPSSPTLSIYDICVSLANIFKSCLPYTNKFEFSETVFLEILDDHNEGTGQYYLNNGDIKNVYTSIFFPNYTDPKLSSQEDYDDLCDFGNTNDNNVVMNEFLNKLTELLSAYRRKIINSEAYLYAINSNLADITNQKRIHDKLFYK